jgi:hypothetical protein
LAGGTGAIALVAPRAARADPRPRDGGVLSYELHADLTSVFFRTQSFPVTGTCLTGTGIAPVSVYGQTSNGRGVGEGPAIGASASYMHFVMPKATGDSPWWALRAGGGIDLGVLYGNVPTGVTPVAGDLCPKFEKATHDVDYGDGPLLLFQVPFHLGVQMGLGNFHDGYAWRGIVLGAGWAPTFTYLKPSGVGGHGHVSLAGMELSLDFTTLYGRTDGHPQRHIRFSALLLPATESGAPFMMTFAFGAVWY